MNRFLVLSFLIMAAFTACPMAGNTTSWAQRIKSSLSSFYCKALSYCSFKKKPQPTPSEPQQLQRNSHVSTMLSSQANQLQKRHEQIRMAAWTSTLKTVPSKQTNLHEDDIQNPVLISKKIPLRKQPAHLLEYNNPTLAQNFADFYAQEYARMLKAQDCIITNHTPTVEIPVKHAGLLITKRSNAIYKEHKLARFSYDKNEAIDTIVINGSCTDTNEMIIRQHEEHLGQPAVYVTVKHNEKDALDKAEVTFTIHKNKLVVKIDNAEHYDLELHVPRRMQRPEIKFTRTQREPLQVMKQ